MKFTVFDPDLILIDQKHWQARASNCLDRLLALSVHRRWLSQDDTHLIISHELSDRVYSSLSWICQTPELRDFQTFICDDLSRAMHIDAHSGASVEVLPDDVICRCTSDESVLGAWSSLICTWLGSHTSVTGGVQVATWFVHGERAHIESVTVSIRRAAAVEFFALPLVWDDASWQAKFVSDHSWPDLDSCVQAYFESSDAMKNHPNARIRPINFKGTGKFWKSVNRLADPVLRQALIKSLAKKVYGISDKGLGDKAVGDKRRFRVTDFWRVIYEDRGSYLLLYEFGEHNI